MFYFLLKQLKKNLSFLSGNSFLRIHVMDIGAGPLSAGDLTSGQVRILNERFKVEVLLEIVCKLLRCWNIFHAFSTISPRLQNFFLFIDEEKDYFGEDLKAWKAWRAENEQCSLSFSNAASILKINQEKDFEEGCKNVQAEDNSGKEHDFRVCHCKGDCNSIFEEGDQSLSVYQNGSPLIPTCLGSVYNCPNFNFIDY